MIQNSKKIKTIIIIGGGAAGYFAAITCAEKNPKNKIYLLEATSRPLKKVLISGGGRCNVTHHCFDPQLLSKNYPRGSRELLSVFSRFQPQDTVQWFKEKGVDLKTEKDGRMFPVTDRSETIAECLEEQVKKHKINLVVSSSVKEIKKIENQFLVRSNTEEYLSDVVLLATGSNPIGYRLAQSLGHSIVDPVPSLFTFNVSDSRIKDLPGVSFEKVHLKLIFDKSKLEQIGPLLITHWGLSGPAILKLSAFGSRLLFESQYKAQLVINFLPEDKKEFIEDQFFKFKEKNLNKKIYNYRPFESIPGRFWQKILFFHEIRNEDLWGDVSHKLIHKIINELTHAQYRVNGKGVFKEEFVTAGGIDLKEVNFKTMESKICPNLYFAGEILDIDGITGGFNFQSAWSTGAIAGQAISIV